jgi:hypothetical protein
LLRLGWVLRSVERVAYVGEMPSSPVPDEWFAGLDREEPEARSEARPPGPPIALRLRTLSHCRDTVHLANLMNLYPDLPDQMRYDYLFHTGALDKRRTTGWARRPRENQADLELVMAAYNMSKAKARQALKVLRPEQIEALRNWMGRGGG